MRTLPGEQLARYRQIISPDLNHLVLGFVPINRSLDHLTVIVPKLSSLSKVWGIDNINGFGLGIATAKLLGVLSHQFPEFYNLRENKLTSNEIRLTQEARDLIVKTEAETEGDFLPLLINPKQLFGGYSTRDSQPTTVDGGPLPLCSAYATSLLLSLPNELIDWDDLYLLCSAEEYSPNNKGWDYIPSFWRKSRKTDAFGYCVMPKWHAPV